MLKNYLKIALRNLRKHKMYSFINIGGLSVGVGCCLLIMLFVRSEWSYDRFHTDADRLHRAWVLEDYGENQQFFNTVTPIPLGPTLAETFPEIEAQVRFFTMTDQVRRGETSFNEPLSVADANFFEVFDFSLVRGEAARVLTERNSVVITEEIAERYFGDDDPLGQTLSITLGQMTADFLVTGVAEDVPTHSSIQFSLLLSFALGDEIFSERSRQSWFNVLPETYVRVAEGVDPAALEAKFPTMVTQVLGDRVEAGQYSVGLQPMTDIHLNPAYPTGIATVSDPAYSYILFGIALLILLLACINFVTLAIGRSADRAMEVGVRKVVGAGRGHLMRQFWGEALLTTALSLLFGVVLAQTLLPLFNDFAGQTLTLNFDGGTWLFLAGLLALIGLVAGSYPAAVLSRFRPIEVLKGQIKIQGDRSLLRRTLVVAQFALSIFLIVATLIMAQQLRFLRTAGLGFDKELVVVIPTAQSIDEGKRLTELFRTEVAGAPEVVRVAMSMFTFGEGGWASLGYNADDGSYRDLRMNVVDEHYLPTLGMELVAGRNFSEDITSDAEQAIIVNEALVAEYGWADPVGQRLPGKFGDHAVIGVVKDFNFASLHTPVEPLVLAMDRRAMFAGVSDVGFPASPNPKISVRVRGNNLPSTVALLERTWETVAPDLPFAYQFLDEVVDSQYRQEERLGEMIGIATLLAIFIACLGLFGLAALTAVRRTKEIGIRKVMGASAASIVVLLSKDLTRLVAVAFVLAVPAAYFAMNRWLEDFAFRTELTGWTFLLAGLAALLIAWLTVSYQSIKAALSNPVDSLRYE